MKWRVGKDRAKTAMKLLLGKLAEGVKQNNGQQKKEDWRQRKATWAKNGRL